MTTRRILVLAATAFLVVLSAASGSATAAAVQKIRMNLPTLPDHDPFLEGRFTWNGGTKGISWEADPTTEDLKPDRVEADTAQRAEFRVDRHLNSNQGFCTYPAWEPDCSATVDRTGGTFVNEQAFPDDVFVSQPLPRDVYVNVTRGFQFALYLQKHPESQNADGTYATPCRPKTDHVGVAEWPGNLAFDSQASWIEPSLELTLKAGDQVIGGAYPVNSLIGNWWEGDIQWDGDTLLHPRIPRAYGVCFFQMHSEVPVLRKGTILTLSVAHALQQYPYPYGFKDDHASVIRIWEYPFDELVYRHPELAPAGPEDESGLEATPPATASTGIAVVGLAVGALAGRGRRGALMALALGALVVSGCVSGTPEANARGRSGETLSGEQQQDFVALPDGEGIGNSTGVIFGLVHDDLHIPLRDVHVTIKGTPKFVETDYRGRFRFQEMPPGSHVLRFDHKDFRSFEADVTVKAGLGSRTDILLYPTARKEGDARPHSHNYWDGKTEAGLGTYTLAPTCSGTPETCKLTTDFRTLPTTTQPNTVMPGTSEVEVVLDWDPNVLGVDRLGVRADPEPTEPQWAEIWGTYPLQFAPRAPKVPFRIQTTWEMTDNGHALYSDWEFSWFVPPSQERKMGQAHPATAIDAPLGTVTATVKIHQGGTLPLEPGHVDHWKGRDVRLVLDQDISADLGWNDGPPGMPTCLGLGIVVNDCYQPTFGGWWGYTSWGAGCWWCQDAYDDGASPVIPPGTKSVQLYITRNRAASPVDYDPIFYLKMNDVPNYLSDAPILRGYTALTGGSTTSGNTSFTINVNPQQADFTYTQWSNWRITWRPDNEQAFWADAERRKQETENAPEVFEEAPVTFHLQAWASR